MYLLYVDESGVHDGAHPFVLGGVAVHERDTIRLQRRLDVAVASTVGSVAEPSTLELHGSEMWNAPARSPWSAIDRPTRIRTLNAAYRALAGFAPTDPATPLVAFGVVVDRSFRTGWSQEQRERWAYEVLFHKFDALVARSPDRREGLVIHDRRRSEPAIQSWATRWRSGGAYLGALRHHAEVPLFADSRATRLLQAADLVSYALFREHQNPLPAEAGSDAIWSLYDAVGTRLHGHVHYSRDYATGDCRCTACTFRLRSHAARTLAHRIPRSQVSVMPLS